MFSRERIISIMMLLAILIISLVFASYREGLAGIKDVNEEAPSKADGDSSKSKMDNVLPKDGILLGKPTTLTVAEITKTLKNNPGVQNLIDNQKK